MRLTLPVVIALLAFGCDRPRETRVHSTEGEDTAIVAGRNGGGATAATRRPAAKTYSDRLVLGELTVTLEETTLDAVRERFGGIQRDSGDAGGAWSWLCYALDGGGSVEVGSGEIGSRDVIAAVELSADPGDPGCSAVALEVDDVQLENELQLGIDAAILQARFGPAVQRGDTLWFTNEQDVGADFTTVRMLAVVVRDGRAHSINSSRVTTN